MPDFCAVTLIAVILSRRFESQACRSPTSIAVYTSLSQAVSLGEGSGLGNDVGRGAEGAGEDIFTFQNILSPPMLTVDYDFQDLDGRILMEGDPSKFTPCQVRVRLVVSTGRSQSLLSRIVNVSLANIPLKQPRPASILPAFNWR